MKAPTGLAACIALLPGCEPFFSDVPFTSNPLVVVEPTTREVVFAWDDDQDGVVSYQLEISNGGDSVIYETAGTPLRVELEIGVLYSAVVRGVDAIGQVSVNSNRVEIVP
jgi:hypothetical protein